MGKLNAWASSVHVTMAAWSAIDRKITGTAKNIFHSVQNGDKYPWLAIDVMAAQKVTNVEIVNRKGYASQTVDMR